MDTLLFIPTSGLQTFLIILLSLMIIITIVGNILVCLSVVLVRKLRSPSNYLLVSLAISDLGVAILVMPLALNLEVKGSWDLGHTLCDMWIAFDVTSCAASILNLCMISVDRYLTITRPLTYGVKRTTKRMFVFIGTVWITSILVSIPPLLVSGNEHGTDDEPQCQISQNIGYQLYATFASFYIPLAVMIILYYKIYNAAKSVVDAEMRSLGITQHRYVPPSYKPLLASRASTTVTTINNNNNNGSGGKKIVSSGESNVLTASHQILHPQHHSLQQPSPPLPSSQHPKNTANCKNHQNYHNQMSHHSQPPSHLHPHHHQHLHQHYQTSTTLGDQRVRNNNNTNTNNNNNNNNNEDNDNNSNQITGADIIKLDCNMASLNEPIGVKGWPMIETGYLKSSSGHHSLNHHHHHHHDNHQMVSPFTTGTVGNPTSTHPHPRNGMICCAGGIAHYPPHAHHYHRNRNLHRHHSSSSGSGVGGGGGSRNGSGKGCPGRSRSSGLQTTLLASYKRVKESVLPSMRRNRRQRGHRSSNRKSSKIMCTIDSGNDDNPISNSGQCDCANMINSNDVAALASSFECDTSQSNQMTSTNRNGQPSTSSSFGLDSHSDQSSSMTAEKRRTSSMLKERKASITLGVIMTAFTACWLPFFILALLRPFNIEIPRTVSSFAYWLGLANSMLNPIIYVTFHHDFRKAFRYLLGFQCASMDGRLRARAYQSQYGASPRHISNDKKPIHLRQQSFEVDEHYQRTYQSDCDRLSAGILSDTGASGGGGDRNRLQIEQCDVNVNPGEHSSTVNSSPRLTSL